MDYGKRVYRLRFPTFRGLQPASRLVIVVDPSHHTMVSLIKSRSSNLVHHTMVIILLLFLCAVNATKIFLVAPNDNDLVHLLSSNPSVVRSPDAETAISSASRDDSVVLLASNDTSMRTHVPVNFYERSTTMGFKGYIEFPEDQFSSTFPTRALSWKQRVVVTPAPLSSPLPLPPMRILQLQGATFIDYCRGQKCNATSNNTHCQHACDHSILSLAQVAGVDVAAFGCNNSERVPLLFQNGNVIIATARLSNIITGRSAPQEAWRTLWTFLLGIHVPKWIPDVRPTFAPTIPLPKDVMINAALRSAHWISTGSTLMVSSFPSSTATFECCSNDSGNQECVLEQCTWENICPAPFLPSEIKNVTCLQEGWSSIIRSNGEQHLMPLFIRTDGNAEASMGLASVAVLVASSLSDARSHRWREQSSAILDYMFRWSDSQTLRGLNATDPTYGIVWWNQKDAKNASGGLTHWSDVDYGSNSACILMSATATASLLETDSWRDPMLYSLFAEIRTTGRRGYRPHAISSDQLTSNGWQTYFHNNSIVDGSVLSPHYSAQAAAYFIFAGNSTGLHLLFSAPAKEYVCSTMIGLTQNVWQWTESMTNELSVMLMTAAWLVRVEPTAEHHAWLDKILARLLVHQNEYGGIKQFFGTGKETGRCNACPPNSNADYGNGEAPLLFYGNETITDCLYSLNFALIGLREVCGGGANANTSMTAKYCKAEEQLIEYLARIQVTSTSHPELDGAWFRAFEYKRWEYWASDSDWGYGPWVTDDGWTNGWIQTAMALKHANTTLWDVMKKESEQWSTEQVNKICQDMLMEESEKYCVQSLSKN